jgi:hypothetical protein
MYYLWTQSVNSVYTMESCSELISWYESTPRERRKVMYLSALLVYAIKPLGVLALLCVVYMYANGEDNPLTGRPTVYNIPEGLSTCGDICDKYCLLSYSH